MKETGTKNLKELTILVDQTTSNGTLSWRNQNSRVKFLKQEVIFSRGTQTLGTISLLIQSGLSLKFIFGSEYKVHTQTLLSIAFPSPNVCDSNMDHLAGVLNCSEHIDWVPFPP